MVEKMVESIIKSPKERVRTQVPVYAIKKRLTEKKRKADIKARRGEKNGDFW